jgi:hypothetical protein
LSAAGEATYRKSCHQRDYSGRMMLTRGDIQGIEGGARNLFVGLEATPRGFAQFGVAGSL